jgi:hypothetical protein
MTRLRRGDYLLPSNDGATLWRLTSYVEGDGLAADDPKSADYGERLAELGDISRKSERESR